ncbi:MAG TPA: RHS repeat-associated core domain-containing protein [Cyclobacteriaceae bacterium]|nr:hypothetical protein [Cyclobacteriaceae bacterium]HMV09133.1 RHS repeat-associated core domain-containing protein [Cyclobacteriaceae bacterium]HMX01498.1 RHS repeat-associated core domain-containing protein [Cyclobacteriaceae bacterium]HMX50232.1 RHS repeat-associated core domain-containing protein [Cyclobacteriaceae bacterium]HMY92300.1 RHS repeat-associated core domain-containing protein [Cyclobacteriaceae bacterium]
MFFDDFTVEHIKSPVVQQDDYYAFGLEFNSYQREHAAKNNYLYNGKEKQDELDLGWLDYGVRMYMADIGRWGVIDPSADKMLAWSPFNYVFNNPTRFVDPDGRDPREGNDVLRIDFDRMRVVDLHGYTGGATRYDPELFKSATREHFDKTMTSPGAIGSTAKWLQYANRAYKAYDAIDDAIGGKNGSIDQASNAYTWQSAASSKNGYSFGEFTADNKVKIRHVHDYTDKLGKGFDNMIDVITTFEKNEDGEYKAKSMDYYKYSVQKNENGEEVRVGQKITLTFGKGITYIGEEFILKPNLKKPKKKDEDNKK